MKKAVVFGYGRNYLINEHDIRNRYEIVGIADNDPAKWGKNGKDYVISPDEIKQLSFDIVLISTNVGRSQILRQLINDLGISPEVVELWFEEAGLKKEWYNTSVISEENGPKVLFEVNIPEREQVRFVLEESGEYMCFDEWFCKNEYRLDVKDEFDVIDIGMNVGVATLYYASFKECKNVYSFEPFEPTYRKAVRNIQMNESIANRVSTYNIALSDHDSVETYDYSVEYPGGMSLLRDQAETDSVNSIKVNVREASGVLEPIINEVYESGRALLMKIDCEGSEYAILSRMLESGLIKKPHYYVMETHFGRHDEAVNTLKENGFTVFSSRIDSELGIIYAVNSCLCK